MSYGATIRRLLPIESASVPSRRELDGEVAAEVEMKFLQRFDEQEIYRKPDRSPPVGIAPEQARGRFTRLVIHAVFHAHDAERVRMLAVKARQCAYAVGRQEFIFVQHVTKNGPELRFTGDGEQAAFTAAVVL